MIFSSTLCGSGLLAKSIQISNLPRLKRYSKSAIQKRSSQDEEAEGRGEAKSPSQKRTQVSSHLLQTAYFLLSLPKVYFRGFQ